MFDDRTVSRFWAKVDRSDDANACWLWTGVTNKKGYGRIKISKAMRTTHRFSLSLKIGRVLAPNEWALHTCDNPSCCNPAHLFLGDAKINVQDMMAKGRHWRQSQTLCKYGHALDRQYHRRNGAPVRGCSTCESLRNRNAYAKRTLKGCNDA